MITVNNTTVLLLVISLIENILAKADMKLLIIHLVVVILVRVMEDIFIKTWLMPFR